VIKAEKPVWDNYIYQNLNLTAGEYQISFFVKADAEAETRNAVRFSIKPSTSPYLDGLKSPFSPKKKVSTEWQQITQTVKIAPTQEGLEGARFTIHLEEAGNTYYIDNVELTKIK
ncbi:MAG: carbohydrate binding domain-containing protein, partial [Bacteroidales bacterium]